MNKCLSINRSSVTHSRWNERTNEQALFIVNNQSVINSSHRWNHTSGEIYFCLNTMYQKTVDNILHQPFFDAGRSGSRSKRFPIFIPSNRNKYDSYINCEKRLIGFVPKLQAISYNSYMNWMSWNVKPRSIWFFDKRGPVISQSLCDKVIRNIEKEFICHIRDVLFDYHILFHADGSQYRYTEYPSIYIAMGYIEAYPVTYFKEDFTENEMKSLTKYLYGQVFIVVLKQEAKIKLYRDINFGKFECLEFPLNAVGIVQATIMVTNRKINVLQKLVSSLGDDDYKKLWNILNK